ncbi:MAG: hypothetical protein Q9216_004584 [Gyalolechia sp. 2 TL-2023]
MADDDIQPKKTPSLNLPASDSTVEVSIINTTTEIVVPAWAFVQPVLKGHESMNMPTFAFLVKNKRLGRNIMFDLGCRKDWWNFAPAAYNTIKNGIPGLNVPKNINEILQEGNEDVGKIEGIVWSHWHWVIRNIAHEGRNVREIEFDKSKKIGQFPAHDLFGDGSFYLLDVPGHAVGHISGLARTTPDTFVFMGGDVCHFGGSYRPTKHAPLPAIIPSQVALDSGRFSSPCPCSIFTACHRDPPNARTSPFYKVTEAPGAWYIDPPVAQQSVERLEEFDADENVFVCVAHDGGLLPVCDWFPNGTLNDWKAKGWKETSKWGFLNELPIDGKPGRPLLAPGLVKEGRVVEKADRLGTVAG